MEHRGRADDLADRAADGARRDGAEAWRHDGEHRLAGRLERWLSEAVVEEAARTRARRAWLRRAYDEDRSLAGVLLAAAERAEVVALGTIAGERVNGTVAAVGADVVMLRNGGAATVLVALDAVTDVAAGSGVSRAQPGTRTMADALRLLQPGVRVRLTTTAGGGATAGRLTGVGHDLVTLERDTTQLRDTMRLLHVPLAALAVVRVDETLD